MNEQELAQWMQSKGFVKDDRGAWHKPKRTIPHFRATPATVTKPVILDARLEPPPRKACYPNRVRISVTSYCCGQQRDADNICAKYGIDCCRHAGLIFDDCPDAIELIVKETRVSTKKEEGFSILITPL